MILISTDTSYFCQIQDCETPKRGTTDKQGGCKDETASDKKTPKAKQMLSLARQDGKQHRFYFSNIHKPWGELGASVHFR